MKARNLIAACLVPLMTTPTTGVSSQTTSRSSSATRRISPAVAVQSISESSAFYYYVAIYGAPPDVVDKYGQHFDSANYRRAMADEFERARYRTAIQKLIEAEVDRINYTNKFAYIGRARFREYSFSDQSFQSRFTIQGSHTSIITLASGHL